MKCEHCGKEGFDFDFPGGLGCPPSGPNCKRAIVYGPGVGEWDCAYVPPNVIDGEPQLTVKTVAMVAMAKCPVCNTEHRSDSFVDSHKVCLSCGNQIRLPAEPH